MFTAEPTPDQLRGEELVIGGAAVRGRYSFGVIPGHRPLCLAKYWVKPVGCHNARTLLLGWVFPAIVRRLCGTR